MTQQTPRETAPIDRPEPARKPGCLYGAWQQPVNRWSEQPDSIHNDAVAREIGMRGGTIPGTVHLAHFRPLIDTIWGPAWYQRGSISLYYTYATTDREDVRAVLREPAQRGAAGQVEGWVEMRDGTVAARGTLSAGATREVPYVRGIELPTRTDGESRILALEPGQELRPVEKFEVEQAGAEQGQILNPTLLYRTLVMGFPRGSVQGRAVGFFGATEVQVHAGPIRCGVPYRKTGQVACVGTSPKTEFAWIDSQLWDGAGRCIAEMRHMTRWMKASSPLWKNP